MRLAAACAAAARRPARRPRLPSRLGRDAAPTASVLAVGGGHLKVAFCADDVVRVAFARDPRLLRPAEPGRGRAPLRRRWR